MIRGWRVFVLGMGLACAAAGETLVLKDPLSEKVFQEWAKIPNEFPHFERNKLLESMSPKAREALEKGRLEKAEPEVLAEIYGKIHRDVRGLDPKLAAKLRAAKIPADLLRDPMPGFKSFSKTLTPEQRLLVDEWLARIEKRTRRGLNPDMLASGEMRKALLDIRREEIEKIADWASLPCTDFTTALARLSPVDQWLLETVLKNREKVQRDRGEVGAADKTRKARERLELWNILAKKSNGNPEQIKGWLDFHDYVVDSGRVGGLIDQLAREKKAKGLFALTTSLTHLEHELKDERVTKALDKALKALDSIWSDSLFPASALASTLPPWALERWRGVIRRESLDLAARQSDFGRALQTVGGHVEKDGKVVIDLRKVRGGLSLKTLQEPEMRAALKQFGLQDLHDSDRKHVVRFDGVSYLPPIASGKLKGMIPTMDAEVHDALVDRYKKFLTTLREAGLRLETEGLSSAGPFAFHPKALDERGKYFQKAMEAFGHEAKDPELWKRIVDPNRLQSLSLGNLLVLPRQRDGRIRVETRKSFEALVEKRVQEWSETANRYGKFIADRNTHSPLRALGNYVEQIQGRGIWGLGLEKPLEADEKSEFEHQLDGFHTELRARLASLAELGLKPEDMRQFRDAVSKLIGQETEMIDKVKDHATWAPVVVGAICVSLFVAPQLTIKAMIVTAGIAAAASAARQTLQVYVDGSAEEISWSQVGEDAFAGAVIAPVFIIPGVNLGATAFFSYQNGKSGYEEWEKGNKATSLFDYTMAAAPWLVMAYQSARAPVKPGTSYYCLVEPPVLEPEIALAKPAHLQPRFQMSGLGGSGTSARGSFSAPSTPASGCALPSDFFCHAPFVNPNHFAPKIPRIFGLERPLDVPERRMPIEERFLEPEFQDPKKIVRDALERKITFDIEDLWELEDAGLSREDISELEKLPPEERRKRLEQIEKKTGRRFTKELWDLIDGKTLIWVGPDAPLRRPTRPYTPVRSPSLPHPFHPKPVASADSGSQPSSPTPAKRQFEKDRADYEFNKYLAEENPTRDPNVARLLEVKDDEPLRQKVLKSAEELLKKKGVESTRVIIEETIDKKKEAREVIEITPKDGGSHLNQYAHDVKTKTGAKVYYDPKKLSLRTGGGFQGTHRAIFLGHHQIDCGPDVDTFEHELKHAQYDHDRRNGKDALVHGVLRAHKGKTVTPGHYGKVYSLEEHATYESDVKRARARGDKKAEKHTTAVLKELNASSRKHVAEAKRKLQKNPPEVEFWQMRLQNDKGEWVRSFWATIDFGDGEMDILIFFEQDLRGKYGAWAAQRVKELAPQTPQERDAALETLQREHLLKKLGELEEMLEKQKQDGFLDPE